VSCGKPVFIKRCCGTIEPHLNDEGIFCPRLDIVGRAPSGSHAGKHPLLLALGIESAEDDPRPLLQRWQEVPYGDKNHERCRLVLEALAQRGGSGWASNLAKDLGSDRQVITRLLDHLNYDGRLRWYAGSAATLEPWEGAQAFSDEYISPELAAFKKALG
jgi:hypothetical protein